MGRDDSREDQRDASDVGSLIARCDQEIAEIRARPETARPGDWAYLPTMGLVDWQIEKRILEEQSMWVSILLIMFYGTSFYWDQVRELNNRGCHVYNDVYVSCPNKPPVGVVAIPEDAVEVVAP